MWNFSNQWGSVKHQMVVPVPSINCCVLNHQNLFYQIQNALAFIWDMCCHLALCLQWIPFHCSYWNHTQILFLHGFVGKGISIRIWQWLYGDTTTTLEMFKIWPLWQKKDSTNMTATLLGDRNIQGLYYKTFLRP